MASYHPEIRRHQAPSREMGISLPPVRANFGRQRRHTVESLDRVSEVATEDERIHDEEAVRSSSFRGPTTGKPSFWRPAAPRLPGGLSLLKKRRSQHGSDSCRATESESKNSDVGSNAGEPPINTDRKKKMSMISLVSSSRRMRHRMLQNLQSNLERLGTRNNTVSHIRAHVLDHSEDKQPRNEADSLSTVILKSLSKPCLCDVMIVGIDEATPVGAPSYLLAAHSDVFLDMLYGSDSADAAENIASPSNQRKFKMPFVGILDMLYDSDLADSAENVNSPPRKRKVKIPFAGSDAIEGFTHFLATRSLPGEHENESSEANLRYICQIYLIGRVYKIASLTSHAYRAACRLMNKFPCLVCAVFDELIELTKLLPSHLTPPSSFDELKDFVLEYLRNSPTETLLGGGTAFLGCEAIESIISDEDMDVCEFTMFTILNSWVKYDDERIETGKSLVSNIKLAYIKPDYLNNVVRKCIFVDSSAVDDALREIDKMLADGSPDKKEHVLVEGAGDDAVNGVYVHMEEDIGLEGCNDFMFVKEAGEGENFSDYGLHRHHSTWAITSCVDHSNILYSCEVPEGDPSALYRAPKSGWKAIGGSDPAPICTWNPSKENSKTAAGGYVAPNLVGTRKKSLEDINQGDHDDGQRRYSLHTMLMLPSDEGHENDDYHSDFDDSCVSFHLDASA